MIMGFIEAIRERQIRGWAYDTTQSSQHLTIIIRLDGVPIGEGIADLLRPDLVDNSIGNGDHGFVINLETALNTRQLHCINAIAVDSDEQEHQLTRLESKTEDRESTTIDLSPIHEFIDRNHLCPVFILGAARSGTSAMAQALLSTGIYSGEEEGHFFALLNRLTLSSKLFTNPTGRK